MLNIDGIPAKIWGAESERVYLYVHGMSGSKEDAEGFSDVAGSFGFQVLSFDVGSFDPVSTPPEIEKVYEFASERWQSISLYGVSLGAWFSMICLQDKPLTRTLLVSPVLSMKNMIERMMKSSGVTPEQLREQNTIGALSWEYYEFACAHEISRWDSETRILCAEHDGIVPITEAEGFSAKFGCDLRVMQNGEHWFHTEEQLRFLRDWEAENIA